MGVIAARTFQVASVSPVACSFLVPAGWCPLMSDQEDSASRHKHNPLPFTQRQKRCREEGEETRNTGDSEVLVNCAHCARMSIRPDRTLQEDIFTPKTSQMGTSSPP